MPREKPRIQLALYARPKHPLTYHYALFVAPKNNTGTLIKHHAKNTLQINEIGEMSQPWRYERMTISDVEAEHHLLVRVTVAKVAKTVDEVQQIIQSVLVYQADEGLHFSCHTWVGDVYRELRKKGALTDKSEEWGDAERKTLEYLHKKVKDGRWSGTWNGGTRVPLLNLLEGKEIFD